MDHWELIFAENSAKYKALLMLSQQALQSSVPVWLPSPVTNLLGISKPPSHYFFLLLFNHGGPQRSVTIVSSCKGD